MQNLFEALPEASAFRGLSVLVLPGGGYRDNVHTLGYEGTDVAAWLCSIGFAAFTLQYTLQPRAWHGRAASVRPAIDEALEALAIVRSRGAALQADAPAKVCIMGFSAGAHLAMCVCKAAAESNKPGPDGLLLAYPPARSPICPCLLGSLLLSPLDYIVPWQGIVNPEGEHKWCDMDGIAENAPPTILVASTGDLLLPPRSHADVIYDKWREKGVAVHYVREALGHHGFAMKGWQRQCEQWLCSQLPASSL
eukprot:TRINITY_DN9703_c0_g2_i2.p1 TRINITY_DN9703_c0_g2~~TRINITY_DN9703_c0_g2_i2.p1  ORF type:complete len:251 (+),score=34.21 TRINITY_DN9703_c0_g2_i2:59-811(+)